MKFSKKLLSVFLIILAIMALTAVGVSAKDDNWDDTATAPYAVGGVWYHPATQAVIKNYFDGTIIYGTGDAWAYNYINVHYALGSDGKGHFYSQYEEGNHKRLTAFGYANVEEQLVYAVNDGKIAAADYYRNSAEFSSLNTGHEDGSLTSSIENLLVAVNRYNDNVETWIKTYKSGDAAWYYNFYIGGVRIYVHDTYNSIIDDEENRCEYWGCTTMGHYYDSLGGEHVQRVGLNLVRHADLGTAPIVKVVNHKWNLCIAGDGTTDKTWFYGRVTIDNNCWVPEETVGRPEPENQPVAILVTDTEETNQSLCIMMGSRITNSAVPAGKYYGIGVKVDTVKAEKYPVKVGSTGLNSSGVTKGGAIELCPNNTVIENCAIAVEQVCGTTRLRETYNTFPTNSSSFGNNAKCINLYYGKGNTVSKWTDTLAPFISTGLKIVLHNPEFWGNGNEIFDSGYIVRNTGSTALAAFNARSDGFVTDSVGGNTYIPVKLSKAEQEALVNVTSLENIGELAQHVEIKYMGDEETGNGSWVRSVSDDGNVYPLVKFVRNSVLNVRTNRLYETLYDAVNATGDYALLDGDVLVFLDNTFETKTTEIDKNITIRAAYQGEDNDERTYTNSDATARWSELPVGGKGIVVKSGKTVTFGSPANTVTGSILWGNADWYTAPGRTLEEPADGTVIIYHDSTTEYIENAKYGKLTLDGADRLTNIIYIDGDATVNMTNSLIAVKNSHAYGVNVNNGDFNIAAAPEFAGNATADFYLNSSRTDDNAIEDNMVITKAGRLDYDVTVLTVELGAADTNLYAGRNVVVTGDDTNPVTSGDLDIFTLAATTVLPDELTYAYTASDKRISKPVLELVSDYFYIVHSSVAEGGTGRVESLKASDYTSGLDITQKVYQKVGGTGASSKHLYGGLYKDGTFETPFTTATEFEGSYSSDFNGLDITPEAGDTYYLKEVSADDYLKLMNFIDYDTMLDGSLYLQAIYAVTVLDSTNYASYGFITDKTGTLRTLKADSFATSTNDDMVYKKATYQGGTVTPAQAFKKTGLTGYFGIIKVFGDKDQHNKLEDLNNICYAPYWVTYDNVQVFNSDCRTFDPENEYLAAGNYSDYVPTTGSLLDNAENSALNYCREYITVSTSALPLAVASRFTGAEIPEITKYDNGSVSIQCATVSDMTDHVLYNGKDGYVFAGWYTDAEYTNAADFSEVGDDMTVYAKYIPADSIEVSFAKTKKNATATISMADEGFTGITVNVNGTVNEASVNADATRLNSIIAALLNKQTVNVYTAELAGVKNGENIITVCWTTEDGSQISDYTLNCTYSFGTFSIN